MTYDKRYYLQSRANPQSVTVSGSGFSPVTQNLKLWFATPFESSFTHQVPSIYIETVANCLFLDALDIFVDGRNMTEA